MRRLDSGLLPGTAGARRGYGAAAGRRIGCTRSFAAGEESPAQRALGPGPGPLRLRISKRTTCMGGARELGGCAESGAISPPDRRASPGWSTWPHPAVPWLRGTPPALSLACQGRPPWSLAGECEAAARSGRGASRHIRRSKRPRARRPEAQRRPPPRPPAADQLAALRRRLAHGPRLPAQRPRRPWLQRPPGVVCVGQVWLHAAPRLPVRLRYGRHTAVPALEGRVGRDWPACHAQGAQPCRDARRLQVQNQQSRTLPSRTEQVPRQRRLGDDHHDHCLVRRREFLETAACAPWSRPGPEARRPALRRCAAIARRRAPLCSPRLAPPPPPHRCSLSHRPRLSSPKWPRRAPRSGAPRTGFA